MSLSVSITSIGAQGSQGAQLNIGGQTYTASSAGAGIGYNPNSPIAMGLAVVVQNGLGTFAEINLPLDGSSGPTFFDFTGAPTLNNGAAVSINNASAYTVSLAIASLTTGVLGSPALVFINPGTTVSFTFNSSATNSAPMVITGGNASASSLAPIPSGSGGSFVPLVPGSSKKKLSKTTLILIGVGAGLLLLLLLVGLGSLFGAKK